MKLVQGTGRDQDGCGGDGEVPLVALPSHLLQGLSLTLFSAASPMD